MGDNQGKTREAVTHREFGGLAKPQPNEKAGAIAALGVVGQSVSERGAAGKRWHVLGSYRRVRGSGT